MNSVPAAGYRQRRIDHVFTQSGLYRELRHLLTRPMAVTARGVLDAGSMCRDSAVILATLAIALGFQAFLCEGQTSIFAPLLNGTYCELYFETHAWLDIIGYGITDFSPNLESGCGPGWVALPALFLSGTRYRPNESAFDYLVGDTDRFARLRAENCAAKPRFKSVYLEERRRVFDGALMSIAVDYAQSPLMETLRPRRYFSDNILIKAALHLWRVTKNKTPSLQSLSQDEAWARVAALRDEEVHAFQSRLGHVMTSLAS
jgi:hypothetical protein